MKTRIIDCPVVNFEVGKLYISTFSGVIVLCKSVGRDTFDGVVIHSTDKSIGTAGDYVKDYSKVCFQLFTGEVALKND